ncbi:Rec8 like protein-domain-containing protein [Pisolithus croceorrhizus]|nr:Rec8 like protein-domain-containing protein [Pisolithus croceorrhizus]KAI6162174.1 Rec8 like protein-domain-containing protein [Pisolithus thermaeus]
MFFSPDLLSKRDSGFGLLWLAATLGSKASFRKLPKRSVISADISQLCDLIATPVEPLALRLSSNLLVGAARVYRIKQDIYIADLTTCFNSLKRLVEDYRSSTTSEAQLQMAQPSVKPSVVTLRVDPNAAFSLNLDNMVADWDEYSNFPVPDVSSDDDYDPRAPKQKRMMKGRSSRIPSSSVDEAARANTHTLDESHEYLFPYTFDGSLCESAAVVPSSSQLGGFGIDDAFFGAFHGLDITEGVGDDLLKELGEGWGVSSAKSKAKEKTPVLEDFEHAVDVDYDMHDINADMIVQDPLQHDATTTSRPNAHDQLVESLPAPVNASVRSPHPITDQCDEASEDGPLEEKTCLPKRNKRQKLVFDVRTELTDKELKATRMHYVEDQGAIRRELQNKRFERECASLINDLLWGLPDHVQAEELVEFWTNQCKTRIEARTDKCALRNHVGVPTIPVVVNAEWLDAPWEANDLDTAFDYGAETHANEHLESSKLRSSEEPGQGRQASRRSSALFHLVGNDAQISGDSQRSVLFPWDNAGDNSPESKDDFRARIDHRMSVDHAETQLIRDSSSRRESPIPSRPPSLQFGVASPPTFFRSSGIDDEFIFDVPEDGPLTASDGSGGQASLQKLEKNSLNFLEYARMQYRSLPSLSTHLIFDDVVPRASSTSHVAAAAMYHCLVLATKDLLALHQEEPYGPIAIQIK